MATMRPLDHKRLERQGIAAFNVHVKASEHPRGWVAIVFAHAGDDPEAVMGWFGGFAVWDLELERATGKRMPVLCAAVEK